MPILNDIMDHSVLGPAIRQGREEGRQEGRSEGRIEGRVEGRVEALRELTRHLIEKRFGSLPSLVEARLLKLSAADLDALALRVLDTQSFNDLFPQR